MFWLVTTNLFASQGGVRCYGRERSEGAHKDSLLMGEEARGAFCEAVAEHDHISLWLTA